MLDLPLFKRRVLGAEAHHHAFTGIESAGRMQTHRARLCFETRKPEHLPALAADAGFQQFIAPRVLA